VEFFDAIERITTAKRFFDSHRDMKSAHGAMINIDNMIKRAMLHCVDEMNRIFKSCGCTFKEEKDGTLAVVSPVSDGNITWVKTICDCLEAHEVSQHLPMYLEQRTSIIKSSLRNYEGFSTLNKASGHSASTGKSSPAALLELIKEGTMLYTKGNMFFPRFMEAVLATLRGETLLFSKVLPNSNPQTEKAFCAVCLCVIEELRCIIKPFVGESALENLVGGGSSSGAGSGGSGLMGTSFSIKKADKNVDTKPIILQRKSNLFLIHLDILDTFLANFFDLRNLSTPDDLKDKVLAVPLSTLLDEQRSSIVRSCLLGLEHLLQAIRMTTSTSAISSATNSSNSTSTRAPINTDLHPISGYVLCFCKEVVEFETVYQALLRIADELHMKTDYLPASTIGLESFMIDGLMSRLQEKTKGTVFHLHKNKSTIQLDGSCQVDSSANMFDPQTRSEELENAKIYLFLMNNLDVIASHLRGRLNVLQGNDVSSSPGKRVRKSTYRGTVAHQASGEDDTPLTVLTNQYNSVDNRIQIAVNELCSVISTVLLTCINLDAAQATAEGRTSKSFKMSQTLLEKQLKTCFGAFNETIDLLLSLKAQWRISSTDLRDRVQGQLNLEIMEPYSKFFEQYSKVNFSKKHKDSYLRFPPKRVEDVLNDFFS